MKYTIKEEKNKIKKKIQYAWEIISLVFILSIFTLIMALSSFEKEKEAQVNDYEEVFKESEMYDILEFDEIYKNTDQVCEIEPKIDDNIEK
ncbi:MAG: hypothetical protein IJ398_05280 [Clostridia bacterium]|nr:hypothetical protein [Clostridia bacterium]